VQHFAAGVVFAAAAIELLPKVLKEDPWVAIGGFAVGIAVMFGMRAAPIGLSLLTVAGAALGVWLLSGASATTLAAVLAFGAVAFMYLATEELLVEAHERGETLAGSVTFFVGFLLYMVLSETLG
jgi:ZIP family zinc transporter